MSDLPIPFNSPPMVRAILREIEKPGTGKTQTRRLLKPQPVGEMPKNWTRENDQSVRYAIEDRLWVKEPYRLGVHLNDLKPSECSPTHIWYEADGSVLVGGRKVRADHIQDIPGRARNVKFMRRDFSRITLLVTDVRVERLQDISEKDAIAEGCPGWYSPQHPDIGVTDGQMPHEEFRDLWNSLHGPGAWEANPWVAAITFRPVLGNIDQIGEAA